jgi:hypothetical protein
VLNFAKRTSLVTASFLRTQCTLANCVPHGNAFVLFATADTFRLVICDSRARGRDKVLAIKGLRVSLCDRTKSAIMLDVNDDNVVTDRLYTDNVLDNDTWDDVAACARSDRGLDGSVCE